MKRKILFSLLLVCLFLSLLSVSQATMMDEDFEGASVFVDQGAAAGKSYAVEDNDTTPASANLKGLYLRTYDTGAGSVAKPVFTMTGTQTNQRYFQGTKSYKLAAGQSITAAKPTNGQPIPCGNDRQMFQFALSTDAATAGLGEGSKVGHFKIDYSTDNTNTVSASIIFDFVVSGGKLTVKSVNNNVTVKTIDCGPGKWTLISMICRPQVPAGSAVGDANRNENYTWAAFDPLTNTYKGVQPINPVIPPANPTVTADFNTIGTGLQVFVDSNTTATTVRPNDVASGWGNDGTADATKFESNIQGWQLAADSGTIYIDNIVWNSNLVSDPNLEIDRECAARFTAFNALTAEPAGPVEPPAASVKHWDLY